MSCIHLLARIRARSIHFALTVLVVLASPAASAIVVTTTVDENGTNPNGCALREAVRAINDRSSFGGCVFTPGDAVIELGAETYQLSLNIGVIDRVQITKPLTISGQGRGQTIIERIGAFDDDLLFIVLNEPGSVLFEGFTLQGTRGLFDSAVDFLARPGVDLTLRDMVFRDNIGELGAAFRIQGDEASSVVIERVIFEDNENLGSERFGGPAEGGGIDCSAEESSIIPSLRLVDVIFRNNRVDAAGGALGGGMSSIGCDLELVNVTFDSNVALSTQQSSAGGGLLVIGGDNPNTVALTNVTFFGNSADIAGGFGQSQESTAALTVTLSNVTFADNSAVDAGDHLFQDAGETRLRNVLFGPSMLTACNSTSAPVITLLGGNMDADGSCGVERTAPDPGLADSPTFDGGFTPTVALLRGAAAIDAGINDGCTATDQRGAVRPFDGDGNHIPQCDVGAHEHAPAPSLFSDGFEPNSTPSGERGGRSRK
jgi:CSLREA domain-containing protein